VVTTKTKKKKIKIWLGLLIILGIIALIGVIALLADAPLRHELKTLDIGNIDFAKLHDGTYVGEYKAIKGDSRNATVEVTISRDKITKINILKGAIDSDGKLVELSDGKTIDDLFQRVIKSESLQVDAISGATLTSKAHLKALEKALKQALEE
jgi:uncharacterized protein with FMN-binding domain